jgi:peroxiredoxin
MVTQGNIAPDFTLETDRSEKVTLSKLRGRQVVLFLPPTLLALADEVIE